MVGNSGHKIVLRVARTIGHAAPSAVIEITGAAAHNVGVNINGINRVGDADGAVFSEDIAEVARVALRAVVDKNLVDVDIDAARRKVVVGDGLAQELVAVLRPVTPESFGVGLLVHGLMKGFDNCRGKRARHVADAEAYDICFGVRFLKGVHPVSDVGKEIILLQFEEIGVDAVHIYNIVCFIKQKGAAARSAPFVYLLLLDFNRAVKDLSRGACHKDAV